MSPNITNIHGLPQAIVKAIQADDYSPGESVQLLKHALFAETPFLAQRPSYDNECIVQSYAVPTPNGNRRNNVRHEMTPKKKSHGRSGRGCFSMK